MATPVARSGARSARRLAGGEGHAIFGHHPPCRAGRSARHLRIERIGVDADVVALGRADDGSQAVPHSLTLTGWWKDGAALGAAGTTAIVGHTSSRGGGVFDRLGDLDAGDHITVTSSTGSHHYRVRRVTTIDVDDFAREAARIYARSGPSRLVIMTCGDYNGQTFESTIAVWATPVR